MKLLITGGSGTLGQEITNLALAKKHQVHILSRNKKLVSKNINLKYFYWDPYSEEIDINCFNGVDAVINLAGFSVFNFWTTKNKSKILKSRLDSTYFILKQIKEKGIKLKSFINASGIAAYSNSLTKVSSEDDSENIKDSFINQVVIKWESKVLEFEKKLPEISFSVIRIGLVLSKSGGVFKISKNLSKIFLLSALGSGNQWQSWIHVVDVANFFTKCAERNHRGVFNLVSPNPITQNELLRKIALHNKSQIIFPNIPRFIVKIFFGEMSELVLSSQKVISNKLNDFVFKFPKIDDALKDLSK
jgi:uncharacterized protein (TIGR01777 family)|tara:strand:- start:3711 stop:4619 length:909 start_codon:yes stop_codon:yes gene_type:complete